MVNTPRDKSEKKASRKENKKKPDPPPLLTEGQFIAAPSGNQYLVEAKLGKGGFGEVHKVSLHKDLAKKYAMKVERNSISKEGSSSQSRLKVEIRVFDTIAASSNAVIDKSHFVKAYDKGKTDTFTYYVMDLLWSSLSRIISGTLRGATRSATKINIARQTLASIHALHELGFLHRDIKPANFAVGLPPRDDTIYMLDFGIARAFREKDGTVKSARAKVSFLGTEKYASIRCLRGEEQCRKDDLEAWLYMMLEIYNKNNLSWGSLKDRKAILEAKIELMRDSHGLESAGTLKIPKQYHDIIRGIYKMEYADAGDFAIFNEQLDSIVREEKFDDTQPFDWIGKYEVEQKKKEKVEEEKKKKRDEEGKKEEKEEIEEEMKKEEDNENCLM